MKIILMTTATKKHQQTAAIEKHCCQYYNEFIVPRTQLGRCSFNGNVVHVNSEQNANPNTVTVKPCDKIDRSCIISDRFSVSSSCSY